MICDVEEALCPYHGGHAFFTLAFDGCLFDKLDFDAWGKERMTQSLDGKVSSADEGNGGSMRPWEALHAMLAKAVLHSETKVGMAKIGISLHRAQSKECYSVQFVCNACGRCTDILFPVAADRSHRDQADRIMLAVFAPYFQLIGPAPPPPPPPPPPGPRVGYVQTQFPPPMPTLQSGSLRADLWIPGSAQLKEDKMNTERRWRCGGDGETESTASGTISNYVPSDPPAPPVKLWNCYWNHGRSQQPVNPPAADWIYSDKPEWRWSWTGLGPDDWEWSDEWR